LFRKHHHGALTFSIWYAFTENFVLALSHADMQRGKRSLLGKMPGDEWQRFANLRTLLGYLYAHPGKKLLCMGSELAEIEERSADAGLPWHLLDDPRHAGVRRFVGALNALHRTEPALHELDFSADGFEWIDHNDVEQSVIAFLRKDSTGKRLVLAVLNFTPVPRLNYQIGVPHPGFWQEVLNSDAFDYGGSGQGNFGGVDAAPTPMHGRYQSLTLTLPPLSASFFRRVLVERAKPR
jgi:1,4-alpha-glucan branching enzyme